MTELKIDRTGWPSGPWDNEPEDRLEFRHAGFDCLLLRNAMGCWCGYVGLPPQHPGWGKDYDDIDLDVHGGLTYANTAGTHIRKEGEVLDERWWIGFDTAHFQDICPGMLAFEMKQGWDPTTTNRGTYRTRDWTQLQTHALAEQVFDISREAREGAEAAPEVTE